MYIPPTAKECPAPFIFSQAIVTNCPPTCGATDMSYMRDRCSTMPHAGCTCPPGLLRLNNTCVEAEDCQCMGDDGRYYNKDEMIDSVDNCLKW